MKKDVEGNEESIKAYIHIYNLLKKIQEMEFKESGSDPIGDLKKLAVKYRIPKDRRWNWIWTSYKEINNVEVERFHFSNPYRRVQWAMRYIPGGKQTPNGMKRAKRQGKPVNWAFDFLLYALVNDMYQLKGRPDYQGVLRILEKYHIEEVSLLTYENLRKNFSKIKFYDLDGVMGILTMLYEACRESGENFLPPNIDIADLPIDTLICLVDALGIKHNKYIHAEEQLPEDYLIRLRGYRTLRNRK